MEFCKDIKLWTLSCLHHNAGKLEGRSSAVIGPTAALKQYKTIEDLDDDINALNLEIWGKVTEVRCFSTPQ